MNISMYLFSDCNLLMFLFAYVQCLWHASCADYFCACYCVIFDVRLVLFSPIVLFSSKCCAWRWQTQNQWIHRWSIPRMNNSLLLMINIHEPRFSCFSLCPISFHCYFHFQLSNCCNSALWKLAYVQLVKGRSHPVLLMCTNAHSTGRRFLFLPSRVLWIEKVRGLWASVRTDVHWMGKRLGSDWINSVFIIYCVSELDLWDDCWTLSVPLKCCGVLPEFPSNFQTAEFLGKNDVSI